MIRPSVISPIWSMAASAFRPNDLEGLLLWLDSTDTNSHILNTLDVVSLLDKSESLTETNVYTQDTSSTVDGWDSSNLNTTLTGGNDGVSIGGVSKDNVLKAVCTAGTSVAHSIRRTTTIVADTPYSTDLYVYIPSSNVVIKGISGQYGGSTPTFYNNIDGSWYLIEDYKGVPNVGAMSFGGTDASGDQTPALDCTGDVIYFAEISINRIEGNHFVQTTSANRPVIDSATVPTDVTFTAANSEYLENTLDISTFSALSQGSIINICDSNSGTVRVFFSMANTATNNDRFLTYFDTNDKAVLEIRENGASVNRLISTSVCTDGTVVEWKLVSGVKKCFINGVEDTIIVDAGTNGSQWMDFPTVDNMSLSSFIKDVPVYYNTIQRELIVTSTPLTDSQSLDLANYLIAKSADAEVRKVLAKFPNPLVGDEEANIRTLVTAMYKSGNWDKTDFKFGWYLSDEANKLTSWKGTKTATNVNSSTFNEFGVLTDGSASYIDTGIVPSTDLTNATLNDIHVEAYCYDNLDSGFPKTLYGVNSGGAAIIQNVQRDGVSIRYLVNTGTLTDYTEAFYEDKTRYGLHREGSGDQELYKDGIEVKTGAAISSTLPTLSIKVGAYDASGTISRYINARQSYFIIGGGYDLTALNEELNLEQSLFNLD